MRSGPFPLPPPRLAPLSLVPITSSRGLERDPALSPDGFQLAYVSNDAAATFDVYVKAVGSPTAMRLTTSAASECCPTWSPDQRSVAFLRLLGDEAVIVTMPALGGTEQRRADVAPWFGSDLSWSPDGRHLAYSARPAAGGSFVVMLLSLDTGEVKPLTSPSPALSGDAFPSFSPDGRHVAFARLSKAGDVTSAEIYLVPASGGEPRRLTRGGRQFVGDLDWTPDGEEVLFFGERMHSVRLSRVGLSGGEPALVWPGGDPLPDEDVAETLAEVSHSFRFSAARKTRRLALTQRRYDTNIYRLATLEPAAATGAPLIGSSRADDSPQFSPDGRKIAFSSTRSGRQEIWVCEGDGSGCGALAPTPHGGTPRWSPDGRSIAFDAWSEQDVHADIFTVEVDTLTVRRVTTSDADDVVPQLVARWAVDLLRIQPFEEVAGLSGARWRRRAATGHGRRRVRCLRDARRDAGRVHEVRRPGPLPDRSRRRRAAADPGQAPLLGTLDDDPGGHLPARPHRGGTDEPRAPGGGWRCPAASWRPSDTGAPVPESSLASSPDGRWLLYVGVEESSDIASVDGYP